MAERLWSGAGCADNPAFRFVKHSDTGVPLYRKVAAGEVRLDDGGAVHIIKRAGPAPDRKENNMPPSIDSIIAKAMAPSDTDTPKEAERKRVIKAALDRGVVSAEQIGAELALESIAKNLRDKHTDMSAEQAFVKAMDLHPDLGNIAVGN